MPITYSNPRKHAEIDNWPMGGTRRGVAVFSIEARPGKGERATRVTQLAAGRPSAPKVLTFATKCRIVDGDDGRTYAACLTMYGHISIYQSNLQFNEESIFPDDPRYAAVRALFDA